MAFVGVAAVADGAFDLDAGEVAAVFEGEVEGGHVSPGLGDAEAEFGGAGHETQFGPLAPRLGVADVHTWIFQMGALEMNLERKKRGLRRPRCLLSLLLFYQVWGSEPERDWEIYLAWKLRVRGN